MQNTLEDMLPSESAFEHRQLQERVLEALWYAGCPLSQKEIIQGAKPFREFGHLRRALEPLDAFYDAGLFETALHTMRVTLDASKMSDYLGISRQKDPFWHQTFVLAAYLHDLGKTDQSLRGIAEKKEGFTANDMKKMTSHVEYSLKNIFDPAVRAIVSKHHEHQSTGYCPVSHPPETPETEFLSKTLAIIDFYDAARSRTENGSGKLSQDAVFKKLQHEYGCQDLDYSGNCFPHNLRLGGQLICDLYEAGVFGKDASEFKKPFSFIWREGGSETFFTQQFYRLKKFFLFY